MIVPKVNINTYTVHPSIYDSTVHDKMILCREFYLQLTTTKFNIDWSAYDMCIFSIITVYVVDPFSMACGYYIIYMVSTDKQNKLARICYTDGMLSRNVYEPKCSYSTKLLKYKVAVFKIMCIIWFVFLQNYSTFYTDLTITYYKFFFQPSRQEQSSSRLLLDQWTVLDDTQNRVLRRLFTV